MDLIAWIVVGALAGWIASMIMGRNDTMNWLENIVVGIVGAFLGGFLFQLFTEGDFDMGFDLVPLIISIVGAIVLLFIWGLIRGEKA